MDLSPLSAGTTTIRAVSFGIAFIGLAFWELLAPRRSDAARRHRWPVNLGLGACNVLVVRVLASVSGAARGVVTSVVTSVATSVATSAATSVVVIPLTRGLLGSGILGSTVVAVAADRSGWGLLRATDMPIWIEWSVALVALDLAVYVQHRLFHSVPWLWRWHRLHHADVAFDISTGVRFHPLEIATSAVFKGAAVAAVGASVAQALAFEIALSTGALFSHANARVAWDGWIRRCLVTPDMHRVHHSPIRDEQDSNFGFCLSWWDRLFGTYRAAPRAPHDAMRIGVDAATR